MPRIKTDIPEIASLKEEITKKIGFTLKTHADFEKLTTLIENSALRYHISTTTLERLWKYSTRSYDNVSERTLDMLCQFLGDSDWRGFLNRLKISAQKESELFVGKTIYSSKLRVGTRLKIGWMPNRICVIRYLGDNKFIAEHTENATIQPGDTFTCAQFQEGKLLCMDNFTHAVDEETSYIVGKTHGLTTLSILTDGQ